MAPTKVMLPTTEGVVTNVSVIGIGNMGKPIAEALIRAGFRVTVFDAAGTRERAPAHSVVAESAAAAATNADLAILSLPNGRVCQQVVQDILATDCIPRFIANTSTIASREAIALHSALERHEVVYVDAPISGMITRARQGKLSMMYSGSSMTLELLRPALSTFASSIFHVGVEPGQGQTMKALNNYLSAAALVITSEALAFGEAAGLSMATILDVLNVSTGRNIATEAMFPNWILPKTYRAGFLSQMLWKDIEIYLEAAKAEGTRLNVAREVANTIQTFVSQGPDVDMTMIYPFTVASPN